MTSLKHAIALTVALAVGAPQPARAEAPRRIVSLNLCTDQLVMLLAEPGRIAALSWLARDPTLSAMAAEAQRHASVRGDAEEVLRLEPDLILASPYSARASVQLLTRLGRRIETVPLAQDLDGVRAGLRQVGQAIGENERSERLIADFDARLRHLARGAGASRPSALVYHVAGLASGPGSLADHVLQSAGYRNATANLPLDARGAVPLEALVARPPDLLVLAQTGSEYRTVQADNLRHPVLAQLMARVPNVRIPQRLWICGTPHVADAIAMLAEARAQTERAR